MTRWPSQGCIGDWSDMWGNTLEWYICDDVCDMWYMCGKYTILWPSSGDRIKCVLEIKLIYVGSTKFCIQRKNDKALLKLKAVCWDNENWGFYWRWTFPLWITVCGDQCGGTFWWNIPRIANTVPVTLYSRVTIQILILLFLNVRKVISVSGVKSHIK